MHTDRVEGSLSVVCWMCVCVWCCDVVPALMQGSIMVLMSPSRPAAPVARRVWWGMSRDSTRGELWASGAGRQHQPLTSLYALHLHSDDAHLLLHRVVMIGDGATDMEAAPPAVGHLCNSSDVMLTSLPTSLFLFRTHSLGLEGMW